MGYHLSFTLLTDKNRVKGYSKCFLRNFHVEKYRSMNAIVAYYSTFSYDSYSLHILWLVYTSLYTSHCWASPRISMVTARLSLFRLVITDFNVWYCGFFIMTSCTVGQWYLRIMKKVQIKLKFHNITCPCRNRTIILICIRFPGSKILPFDPLRHHAITQFISS